jgi:integrase
MPRSTGVRQLPSKRCGCKRCREAYPQPERGATKNCTASWQARWYDASGERQSVTRKRKEDALAVKTAAEAAIDAGTYIDPKRGAITVAAWHKKWLEGRTVERATENRDTWAWTGHIEPRWGRVALRSVTYMDVQAWVTGLEKHLAATSVRSVLNGLSMLMGAALLDRRVGYNPCAGVKTKPAKRRHARESRPPTIEQVKAASDLIRLEVDRALPLIILETGLRWGEITGLLPDALDLARGELDVLRILEEVRGICALRDYPKSEAGFRTIPLTLAAVTLFRRHLEIQPADDGQPIFRAPLGGYQRSANYRGRAWLPATIAAGIHVERKHPSGLTDHWPTPHDIRHTWASRLENAGVPESTRKELLGHERPTGDVTWRYTHGAEDVRAMVLAALGDDPEAPVKPLVRGLRLVG